MTHTQKMLRIIQMNMSHTQNRPPDENVTHTEEAENNRDENVTHTQKRLRITKIKNSKLVKLISLRPEL